MLRIGEVFKNFTEGTAFLLRDRLQILSLILSEIKLQFPLKSSENQRGKEVN